MGFYPRFTRLTSMFNKNMLFNAAKLLNRYRVASPATLPMSCAWRVKLAHESQEIKALDSGLRSPAIVSYSDLAVLTRKDFIKKLLHLAFWHL